MKPPTKQSPLEKLLADKEQIRQQCRLQEQKLNDNFSFLHENAGSLFLSGLSSWLFPGSGTANKNKALPSSERSQAVHAPASSPGFPDLLSVGKIFIPVLWDIAQPVIIAWGIRKARKIIGNALTGKKGKK
jgi:hypothetical protein